MACACKVNQQLDYITKKYGPKGPNQQATHMAADFYDILTDVGAFIAKILLTPFLIIYMIWIVVFKGARNLRVNDLIFFKNL